ncbi:MAG: glycosyltransferase family 39 protein [Candidatus Promineifilaceae bacterium]|nr:glycosyltransferase family 39 protein [Candidatus Promineifilaceae bacterium]
MALTVEHLLYGLILLGGAVLRLAGLGRTPLSPDEAAIALSVFDYWQPGVATAPSGSPALYSMLVPLSQIVGFEDWSMRLAPALVGLSTVLLPSLLRHRIGRRGALLASTFLALSPLHVIVSRTVSGHALAVFAALFAAIAILRWLERGRPGWFYLFLGTSAFGLTTDGLFLSILLALAIAYLLRRLLGPELGFEDLLGVPAVEPRTLRNGGLFFLAVFIAFSTAFLLNLLGYSGVGQLAVAWLSGFGFAESATHWRELFGALLRYELLLTAFGLVAALWAIRKDAPAPLFLVYWLVGSGALLLLRSGQVDLLLAASLPGYLLIGCLGQSVSLQQGGRYSWFALALIVICGLVAATNLAQFARLAGLAGSAASVNLFLVFVAVATCIVVMAVLYSWRPLTAYYGAYFGTLALLVLFNWNAAWRLGQQGANDPREPWVGMATDDDTSVMTTVVTDISWEVARSASGLEIVSLIDNPAIRWNLRAFGQLEFVATIPPNSRPQTLITPVGYEPALEADYIGTDFGYQRPELQHQLPLYDALKWWLFQESPLSVKEEGLIFWIRSDLASLPESGDA